MPRIPIIITDYTKDISKATDSLSAGPPRPMPRIPITITDYTKDISKATESFLAGTPRPMSRIPILRPSYSRTTNTHTTKHTSPKRWKNKHSSPYRWKGQDTTSAGRIRRLPLPTTRTPTKPTTCTPTRNAMVVALAEGSAYGQGHSLT